MTNSLYQGYLNEIDNWPDKLTHYKPLSNTLMFPREKSLSE